MRFSFLTLVATITPLVVHSQQCDYDVEQRNPQTEYVPFFDVSGTSGSFSFAGDDVLFELVTPSEWKAMEQIGAMRGTSGFYDSLSFARITAKSVGTFRTPHYDAHRGELVYVVSGEALATVVGSPTVTEDVQNDRGRERNRELMKRKPTNSIESMPHTSKTFHLGPGDAFFAPPGYTHTYSSSSDDEPLVALSIYDAGTLSSHDLPQIFKHLPDDLLAQALGLPKKEVKNWYDGPKRVYVQSDGELDYSNVGNGQPWLIKGMDRKLRRAPRSNRNGRVSTKSLDSTNYPELSAAKFSFAITEIAPGALLEPYWTDNADELIYVLEGTDLEVSRSGGDCSPDSFVIGEGHLALHEETTTWLIKNNGKQTAKIFRIFNSNVVTKSTLYDVYHGLPDDVKEAML